jgi:hypothetical protein
MLALNRYDRPLKDILKGPPMSAEERLELEALWQPVIRMQENPDLALIALTGIFVPPHQRMMLMVSHLGAGENINVSSRGTSKSTAICVMYATVRSLLFSKRKGVELSATGFRGGQFIFNDIKRWAEGGWNDQEEGLEFLKRSSRNPDILHRGQNLWDVEWKSFSTLLTLPTTDHDKIRGVRGTDLYIDEANIADDDLIDKVAIPFLVVTGDWRHGGAYAKKNAVYFTTTIDYHWRPFQKRVKATRDAIMKDMAALDAARAGKWERHEELVKNGILDHTLLQFDYTDTIIRQFGTTRDGRPYRVKYPNRDFPLKRFPEGIPFIERDERGFLKKQGTELTGWHTYPIDKKRIESGLVEGETDEASWLSEQRNVTDTADGGVYSNALIDRAVHFGSRCLIPYSQCSDGWKRKYKDELLDYAPTIMWECSDPCVLGVDFASTNDFSAFVVIRIGQMAEGVFEPLTQLGKTTWSNVVWVEQHRGTSHADVSTKIHELMKRYNLIYFHEHEEDDPWKVCRGIGLDMRGGGTGVRDELLHINEEKLKPGDYRIYDPRDKDERVQAFAHEPTSRPMLDAIYSSDMMNSNLVEYTTGQMQNDFLYLPKWYNESERQNDAKLHVGYNASKMLQSQLRKLRQSPTKQARTFYMEGNTNDPANKKDMWAAFIYGAKQQRAHLIRQRMIDEAPPPIGARVTHVASKRRDFGGAAPGSRKL